MTVADHLDECKSAPPKRDSKAPLWVVGATRQPFSGPGEQAVVEVGQQSQSCGSQVGHERADGTCRKKYPDKKPCFTDATVNGGLLSNDSWGWLAGVIGYAPSASGDNNNAFSHSGREPAMIAVRPASAYRTEEACEQFDRERPGRRLPHDELLAESPSLPPDDCRYACSFG